LDQEEIIMMTIFASEWFTFITSLIICIGLFSIYILFFRSFMSDIDSDTDALLVINPARFDKLNSNSEVKWIKWLHSQTFNTNMHPPSRNEAMTEFENRYFDRTDYAIISKSGDYAPFIGLILTSFSALWFYTSDLNTLGTLSTGELIRRVFPLLSGVAFGAFLNLTCSIFLQIANYHLSVSRQKAIEWFDKANADARIIADEKAEKVIEDFRRSINMNIVENVKLFLNETLKGAALVQQRALDNIKQVQQESNELRESALYATKAARKACEEAGRSATVLGSTIEQLSLNLGPNIAFLSETLSTNARQFQEFSENHANELKSISESTHLLGQAWNNLYPEINTIVSGTKNLVESTRVFQDVLGPAADAILSASQKYVQLTSEMGNSAQAVRGYSESLRSSLASHSNILETVNSSVQNTLVPICSVLSNHAVAFQQNSERLDSTTQQLVSNLETASMGSGRFENVAVQFEQIINNQFLPAMTAMGNLPNKMDEFFNEIQGAGRTLWDSSSAFRQVFEDNRNNLNVANTSIANVQSLVDNSNDAFSELNKSAGSFSSILGQFQETAGLLSKVNDGLSPVPVELSEFLTELRKVAALSDNVTSLAVHLHKLNDVAIELGNAREPLKEFAKLVKSIEASIKEKPPGTWNALLISLGLKKPSN
jgi:methyl-accepting chemotaxis protein